MAAQGSVVVDAPPTGGTTSWATRQNAQAYYNTLSPEQQQGVPTNNLVEWFTNAVNAGVPDAVRIAGGQRGAGEGGWEIEGGYTLDPTGANAVPPSEWLGKRKPTPSELRRYYIEAGKSEDFKRYTDRQLAAWINDSWDIQGNAFRNPGGDLVEKPTEESANYSLPGPSGPGGAPGKPAGSDAAYFGQDDPLQRYLTNLLSSRGGYFGEGPGGAGQGQATSGMQLQGGGIFWTPNQAAQPAAPPPTPRPPRQQPPPQMEAAAQSAQNVFTGGTGTGSTLNLGTAAAPQFPQLGPPTDGLTGLIQRRGAQKPMNSPWNTGAWF